MPPAKNTSPVVWIIAGVAIFLVLTLGGLCVAGALIFVMWRDDGAPKETVSAPTPALSGPASPTASGCRYRETDDFPSASGKRVGLPPASPPANATTHDVIIATNRGPLILRVDAAKAPCTVNSFVHLIEKKYFDGTGCHRLTTSGIFVLQCGDPTGSGSGGPGYEFDDENLPGASGVNYPTGTVAMANAGPGTNGSQFFIIHRDTTLPPNYTVFGQVTAGLDVIEAVAAGGVDPTQGDGDGPPKLMITLTTLTVR
jgi:peptidyl-prolyl cis-trans isomerase B (cyclophilin B)